MTYDLSEQPIDYTDITGEVEHIWHNRHRQLDTIPSVFGPHIRIARPGGIEAIGCGVLVYDGGRILLTHQNRWPIRKQLWEMPLGAQEPGETVTAAALREVLEETGAEIDESDLIDLGTFRPHAATLYGFNQLYFARVNTVDIRTDGDDEITACAWVEAQHVVNACRSGELTEASTVVAVLRADARGLLG